MNLDPFRLLFSVLLVCVWFQTQQVSLVSRLLFVWVFLGVLPAVLLCKLEDPVVQLGAGEGLGGCASGHIPCIDQLQGTCGLHCLSHVTASAVTVRIQTQLSLGLPGL